eukprot:scaffold187912_cov42-Prasinocladus_malaysianus.AAC.1
MAEPEMLQLTGTCVLLKLCLGIYTHQNEIRVDHHPNDLQGADLWFEPRIQFFRELLSHLPWDPACVGVADADPLVTHARGAIGVGGTFVEAGSGTAAKEQVLVRQVVDHSLGGSHVLQVLSDDVSPW